MTAPLQMHQRHDRHQVSDVQASRRRVEARVARCDASLQQGADPFGVLIEQATPAQFVEQCVRHGPHDRPK